MRSHALSVLLFSGVLLGASGYAAAADPAEAMVSKPCAGCHGIDGASQGDAPIIAGQSAMYISGAMQAYKSGSRYATIMDRIAKGYSDTQFSSMGKYFSGQKWPTNTQKPDAKLVEKGAALHGSSGCIGCHGAEGVSPMPTAPRLAGQYEGFLLQQMKDYKDPGKAIPNTAMAMRGMLSGMSDDDLAALAAFYASRDL